MKFEELWNILVKSLSESKQFQSLSQTGKFDAKYLGGRIHITTQNSIWTIERFDMHKIWNEGLTLDENLRFKHFSYTQQNIRTLSFILALMRDFVGQNKME
ncbi:MAG: hypothetical protein HY222_04955 [Thaumarchaeota archaeon]|nr:hypothetical protein [Nitrososphaerota archaeon]MBI3641724.1 hypothetical protein [Nitrososphaerota archaeon]